MSSLACKDPRAPLPRLFSLFFNANFGSGSSSYGQTRYGTSYGPWYSIPSYGSQITKVTTTTYGLPTITHGLPTITHYSGGFNQGAFFGALGRK